MPGLVEGRSGYGTATQLARLIMDPAAVAERLLQLKLVFPGANMEQMLLQRKVLQLRARRMVLQLGARLLLEQSLDEISAAAAELRDILPDDVNLDK